MIALQAAVEDALAHLLAEEFYREFSGGVPLDVCLTAARQELIAEYGINRVDWGIPSLFTRADLAFSASASGPQGQSGAGSASPLSTPQNPPQNPPQTNLAVVTDNGARIRLTADGRKMLMNALVNAPWTGSAAGRDLLLQNLPQNLANSVARTTIRFLDLAEIVQMAESWGKMVGGMFDGKYALIELVRQAHELSSGSGGGRRYRKRPPSRPCWIIWKGWSGRFAGDQHRRRAGLRIPIWM